MALVHSARMDGGAGPRFPGQSAAGSENELPRVTGDGAGEHSGDRRQPCLMYPSRLWEGMGSDIQNRMAEATLFKRLMYRACLPVGYRAADAKFRGREAEPVLAGRIWTDQGGLLQPAAGQARAGEAPLRVYRRSAPGAGCLPPDDRHRRGHDGSCTVPASWAFHSTWPATSRWIPWAGCTRGLQSG